MSVHAAKANLVDALKKLRIRFDGVKDQWDDAVRRRFERDYIEPLEGATIAAAKGLDQLEELMQRAKRECGDD
ncbi:MAG: hypothetical protein ACOYN0_03945 [Phycisphaerales bacterium]